MTAFGLYSRGRRWFSMDSWISLISSDPTASVYHLEWITYLCNSIFSRESQVSLLNCSFLRSNSAYSNREANCKTIATISKWLFYQSYTPRMHWNFIRSSSYKMETQSCLPYLHEKELHTWLSIRAQFFNLNAPACPFYYETQCLDKI